MLLNSVEREAGTSSLDYEKLRSRGIELIQGFSGDSWTDFNLHDPGVTILEYLCYALTDLAYRTNFDLEDILTNKHGHIDRHKNYFFTGNEILTTNPVSVNDFRRIIIDRVAEVQNVWLEPLISVNRMHYCKGLYKVYIQLNNQLMDASDKKTEKENEKDNNEILGRVRNCLNESRNVGEDFVEFFILKRRDIRINAVVEIALNENPEEILAEIYSALYLALNPRIHFYSELQLVQKGLGPEEINHGPVLQHGFLLDEDLKPRAKFIDPADLIKTIAGIRGVVLVQDLSIEVSGKKYERELCPVDNEEFLFFKYDLDDLSIQLVNENFKVMVKKSNFSSSLKLKLDQVKRSNLDQADIETSQRDKGKDSFRIKGSYRHLHEYFSIQHFFPEIYQLKITLEDPGFRKSSSQEAEMAKVKQLKAFLMLFEQVIANYLVQLSNIDNIFSAEMNTDNCFTYFSQPIYNVPGAEMIIRAYHDGEKTNNAAEWEKFRNNEKNPHNIFLQRKSETDNTFLNRKNRVLDHILSRFNVVLQNYPLQLYREIYSWDEIEGRVSKGLLWKKEWLTHIVRVLRNRNQAFNYGQHGEGKKMGGFQEKILRLLYIGNEQPKDEAFVIKKLSPVLTKLTMAGVSSATKPGEVAPPPDTFTVKSEGRELKVLKDAVSLSGQPAAKAIEEKGNDATAPLAFKKTGISFFRDALNVNNYKVVPHPDNDKVKLLIYRSPENKFAGNDYWTIAGRFNDVTAAMTARNQFISYLRKISIDSEGFHMLEHILLRPPLHLSHFGFAIADDKDHLQCKHVEWASFEQRDKNIAKLIGYFQTGEVQSAHKFEQKIEGLCNLAVEDSEQPMNFIKPSLLSRHAFKDKQGELREKYVGLINNLKKIAEHTDTGYAKIKTLVKRLNKEEMAEDFFNFRATVILPSWPARFQDPPFRDYIKRLFVENCPAHFRLKFLWLGIKEMAAFETLYWEWLSEINKGNSSKQVSELSDAIISRLYDAGDFK